MPAATGISSRRVIIQRPSQPGSGRILRIVLLADVQRVDHTLQIAFPTSAEPRSGHYFRLFDQCAPTMLVWSGALASDGQWQCRETSTPASRARTTVVSVEYAHSRTPPSKGLALVPSQPLAQGF